MFISAQFLTVIPFFFFRFSGNATFAYIPGCCLPFPCLHPTFPSTEVPLAHPALPLFLAFILLLHSSSCWSIVQLLPIQFTQPCFKLFLHHALTASFCLGTSLLFLLCSSGNPESCLYCLCVLSVKEVELQDTLHLHRIILLPYLTQTVSLYFHPCYSCLLCLQQLMHRMPMHPWRERPVIYCIS